jgi:hypothetical protein
VGCGERKDDDVEGCVSAQMCKRRGKVIKTYFSTKTGSSAKIAFALHHPVVPNAKNSTTSVLEAACK